MDYDPDDRIFTACFYELDKLNFKKFYIPEYGKYQKTNKMSLKFFVKIVTFLLEDIVLKTVLNIEQVRTIKEDF